MDEYVGVIDATRYLYQKLVFIGCLCSVVAANAAVSYRSPAQFNAQDPMEVAATSEQTTALLTHHPNAHILLFPEDTAHCSIGER